MRAVTNDPEWEARMAQLDQRQADLLAANQCAETLPHHNAPGVCPRCGTALTGRQRRWCGGKCQAAWRSQHDWGAARDAAKRRDGHRCVREGCTVTSSTPGTRLEVNHIDPRNGEGYGWGCHNHLANLETLCHEHHLEVTRQQAIDRAALLNRVHRERFPESYPDFGLTPLFDLTIGDSA